MPSGSLLLLVSLGTWSVARLQERTQCGDMLTGSIRTDVIT